MRVSDGIEEGEGGSETAAKEDDLVVPVVCTNGLDVLDGGVEEMGIGGGGWQQVSGCRPTTAALVEEEDGVGGCEGGEDGEEGGEMGGGAGAAVEVEDGGGKGHNKNWW